MIRKGTHASACLHQQGAVGCQNDVCLWQGPAGGVVGAHRLAAACTQKGKQTLVKKETLLTLATDELPCRTWAAALRWR